MSRALTVKALITSLSLGCAALSHASTFVALVGDDDGFGGTQGASSTPGAAFSVFSTPTIAPGNYIGAAGTDATTQSPWGPYTFTFSLNWDTTSLSSIDSAVVEIQSGSVGRRSDGSGFGFAKVSASSGGAFVSLGDLLSVSTGAAASALEESVKLSTFDIAPFITPNSTGSLTIRIDGSSLSAPVDQFALDFVRLSVTQVPEPSSASLVGAGICLLLAGSRLRKSTPN
jgi:hypothetical protein